VTAAAATAEGKEVINRVDSGHHGYGIVLLAVPDTFSCMDAALSKDGVQRLLATSTATQAAEMRDVGCVL
jgi:hypothetical protein